MAFWSKYEQTTRDPKRNFRFKIEFAGLTDGSNASVVWWAKKVGKPNFTVSESKHSFLNHTFYWPGRVEWQTITMTLVDPVLSSQTGDGTVSTLSKLMQDIGYIIPGNAAQTVTQSKKKSNRPSAETDGGLGSVVINQINADGDTLEAWTLQNAFIKKVTYGELDYENDELTSLELELRYDWAECEIDGVTTPFFQAQQG